VTEPFRVAEVTALPFADGAFDAVVCNFALGHFPEPEVALTECVRVMAAGGSLAFSWWDQPERQRVQGLFREAIAELGLSPPANVPQGHNTLRFSDPEPFSVAGRHRTASGAPSPGPVEGNGFLPLAAFGILPIMPLVVVMAPTETQWVQPMPKARSAGESRKCRIVATCGQPKHIA
jgi:SAM-dependent methyltransferase